MKTSRMRTDDEGCSINDNASGTSGGMNAWTCVCVCVCGGGSGVYKGRGGGVRRRIIRD